MSGNDFFKRMCSEALDEMADGKLSWRDQPTNTVLLACFGMLTNHLSGRIMKPLWLFAGSIFAGTVGFIVTRVLG